LTNSSLEQQINQTHDKRQRSEHEKDEVDKEQPHGNRLWLASDQDNISATQKDPGSLSCKLIEFGLLYGAKVASTKRTK
jgi:hypothetical protein